ncbi:CDC42 small effector protein 1 isoform X1 [Marmota monax]|uniref:CDC42 small effector protein 1 isoform X1 n=1 Tax=Marmota monax TaxID=9995 RepID=UPI001EB05306|nr:CDC42 small effector protein 1 isoform X1 [Marmota monax]
MSGLLFSSSLNKDSGPRCRGGAPFSAEGLPWSPAPVPVGTGRTGLRRFSPLSRPEPCQVRALGCTLPRNAWRMEAARDAGARSGCQALTPEPHAPVHLRERWPSGLRKPPPTAPRSHALGPEPDGCRNRVAAVSALGQPHLCRPALGSPTARSEPGKPTRRAPGGRPLPAAAGRPEARGQKDSRFQEDLTLYLRAYSPSLWSC